MTKTPQPSGFETLTCPTYSAPWTFTQVLPFIVFFSCVALTIILCTAIYWRANRRDR